MINLSVTQVQPTQWHQIEVGINPDTALTSNGISSCSFSGLASSLLNPDNNTWLIK